MTINNHITSDITKGVSLITHPRTVCPAVCVPQIHFLSLLSSRYSLLCGWGIANIFPPSLPWYQVPYKLHRVTGLRSPWHPANISLAGLCQLLVFSSFALPPSTLPMAQWARAQVHSLMSGCSLVFRHVKGKLQLLTKVWSQLPVPGTKKQPSFLVMFFSGFLSLNGWLSINLSVEAASTHQPLKAVTF